MHNGAQQTAKRPSVSEADDNELALAARDGHQPSFEKLLKRHYGLIYGVVYRLLGNRQDAEDATQEALINIVRNIKSYDPTLSFFNWVYKIAVNAAKDGYRKKKRYLQVVDECGKEDRKISGNDDLSQDIQDIMETLKKLPAAQREAIVLTVYEELSHAQAAKMLGCAESTVSWRVHEARKTLRMLLKKDLNHD
jgi:RNA polymerase sigma-70 factor (ECF subfamily)